MNTSTSSDSCDQIKKRIPELIKVLEKDSALSHMLLDMINNAN